MLRLRFHLPLFLVLFSFANGRSEEKTCFRSFSIVFAREGVRKREIEEKESSKERHYCVRKIE